MFLINTFLGFLIMQIADILKRDKSSRSSPVKFNIGFFMRDNWLKIVLSLILSMSIATALHLNIDTASKVFADYSQYFSLVYILIGAVPEFILQKLKKKFGINQPEQVVSQGEVFKRK